jgi:hydrophobe/amphiphile efflux-1 (HAE1) family protein
MNISEPFIKRPIATSLFMMGIVVFGMTGYTMLPVAALPTVDFPTIAVTAQLPGASPETMASSVATPLEQQFAAIPGLAQMTSSSGLGTTGITLQFVLSRNIDGAAQDVQTAINAAGGVLPRNLPNPPTYRKVNPSERAILIYAISSDTLPMNQVDDYAYTIIAQKISTVPGVSQVIIAGQQKFAVRVQVDPDALAARGVGLDDVRTALENTSTDQPKGNLENSTQSVTLDTNDQLFKAEAYNDVVVAYRNGAPVRIRDVGNAIDSVELNRVAAWYGTKQAELLLILRAAGANTVSTVDQIKSLVAQMRQSVPPSVKIDLMSDRSDTIRASVSDVRYTLLLTVFLVVMVIFAFLRKMWATIIPGVAVPLSIIGTFGVMYMLGYSLDNLSLMGLTIAVGFVVDDAIVMIENIVRYIEMGDTPMDAALKGAGQIGFTIMSISLSLVAVFIPLIFMSGIIGRLFREFAMTVTVAVMVSLVVSLTLTPVMCALFLKKETEHGGGNRLNQMAERFFSGMLALYGRGLNWVFRHQLPTLLSTLALVVLTVFLYIFIPKGFFPQQDTGFIFGEIDSRQDTSFEGMSALTHQVVDKILQDPAVSGTMAFSGATGGNATENTARVFIQLKLRSQRDASVDQVIQRLRPSVAKITGIKFFMQAGQDINVGGRLSRTQFQYTLTDTNVEELNHWAPIFEQEMKGLPGLQDVASDQQIAAPHIAIEIDRDMASRLGISPQLIDDTLYDAFGSREVATIFSSTNQYRVVLEVQPQFQLDENALSRIYVVSGGAKIPLSAFAHFSHKVEPLSVNHQGQFPAVTLSFNLAPGVSLGEAVERTERMRATIGAPETVQGSFQGTAQAFQDSLSSMPLLVAAAIAVIYIVLGMLYESYIHPITILSSLPSAGVGALLMLMLFRYDLSVIAIIGIILLIGIVKKNAIMMIDFALEAERREGKSPLEAIHEACLLRFRPIMMTTFAALFGSLPLAVSQGVGSDLRRPLGIAIVGGLLVSQVLTLYTTPIIYLYLDRWAARFRPLREEARPESGLKRALSSQAAAPEA